MGKKKSRFMGNSQQDSQEFLTTFLQTVNEEMSRIKQKPKYQQLQGDTSKYSVKQIANQWWNYFKKRDDSIVVDYFQGQMQSTIVCGSCGFKSLTFDNFWGIPLSFQYKTSNLMNLIKDNIGKESQIDDYTCSKCKKSKRCSKITQIFKLPKIIVFQLKRFGGGYSRKGKIKDSVYVSQQINLKEVMSKDSDDFNSRYRLKSSVQHSGQLNYGHYTGHVYSQKDKKWFQANDDYISGRDIELDSPKLYLLFYEQV